MLTKAARSLAAFMTLPMLGRFTALAGALIFLGLTLWASVSIESAVQRTLLIGGLLCGCLGLTICSLRNKPTHVNARTTAAEHVPYQLLANTITDVIYTTDANFRITYVSPSCTSQLGYDPEWLAQHGFTTLATQHRQLRPLLHWLAKIRSVRHAPIELSELEHHLTQQVFILNCLRADGRSVPMELRLSVLREANGTLAGVLGIARDISRQRLAEQDLRMAATVFEHSTAAIMVIDPAGFIVRANQSFVDLTDYPLDEILDQTPYLLAADATQNAHLKKIFADLQKGVIGTFEGEVWFKRPNDERYPVWIGITAVQDEDGDLVSFVCFFNDISERKASEQHIHHLAYFDALTKLPNRSLFQERLQQTLSYASQHHKWLALMFLDLDRFKPINDSLGHAAGDKMLKEVARRLSDSVGPDDTVARMGGDEFTLLLKPEANREKALHRAMGLAEKILAALSEAFILEGREFFVSASIGVALSPQDGTESSQLMKNADTAMYHAKACGKDNYQLYKAQMNARALERLELESDLRHALELNQFKLAYQAQYSSDGLSLSGVEVLLRWEHPTRGVVPPMEFIPLLEELGLVVHVGDWVLREACLQMREWDERGFKVPKIGINLSARQFNDGQLHHRLTRILKDTGLEPQRLELELTESILMRDVNLALSVLRGFKRLGIGIAVDDFGTGYSSLNYLKQFPIDVLKIDRSFVDGLPSGEQDAQIARAIIAMAHSLNLKVIAEGVETSEQLAFLQRYHCDQVQGYLLGKPLSLLDFEGQMQVHQPKVAANDYN